MLYKNLHFLGGLFWVITDYNSRDGTRVKAVYETHYVLCKNLWFQHKQRLKNTSSPQGRLAGLPPHPIIATCSPGAVRWARCRSRRACSSALQHWEAECRVHAVMTLWQEPLTLPDIFHCRHKGKKLAWHSLLYLIFKQDILLLFVPYSTTQIPTFRKKFLSLISSIQVYRLDHNGLELVIHPFIKPPIRHHHLKRGWSPKNSPMILYLYICILVYHPVWK